MKFGSYKNRVFAAGLAAVSLLAACSTLSPVSAAGWETGTWSHLLPGGTSPQAQVRELALRSPWLVPAAAPTAQGELLPVSQQAARKVIRLTNLERERVGLPPLTEDPALSRAAQVRAMDSAVLFDHVRPDGSSYPDLMEEFGVQFNYYAENLAKKQKSPAQAVREWMESPSHRENILRETVDRIGVGIYRDPEGVLYWCQLYAGLE